MQRRDYRTLSIAINRAIGRILKDESICTQSLLDIQKYHHILIDEICDNIKLENAPFNRERFVATIEGYSK